MLKITHIERISTTSTGAEANGRSKVPSFSPDGTKLVFESAAPDLVAGDTNAAVDVFMKDLQTGDLRRISTDSDGNQARFGGRFPVFTADGTSVAFFSNSKYLVDDGAIGGEDIFLKNIESDELERLVYRGDEDGYPTYMPPSFSKDGTLLVFSSYVRNYNKGQDVGGTSHIHIKNLDSGEFRKVSLNPSGSQGNNNSTNPVLSPDGTKVAFYTAASNLVLGSTEAGILIVKDLQTGASQHIANDPYYEDPGYSPSFSPDGTKLVFVANDPALGGQDRNGFGGDVFIKDLNTGAVTQISVNEAGESGNGGSSSPVFSPDGTKVAFITSSTNLIETDLPTHGRLIIKDLLTGEMTASAEDMSVSSRDLAFSSDGTKIAFSGFDYWAEKPAFAQQDIYVLTLEETEVSGNMGVTLKGGDHADKIVGTEDNDSLYGGDGRDNISALAGHDRLYGEGGFDTLRGGDGDNTLNGGNGEDVLFGEGGNDRLVGGAASDSLRGGNGDDVLLGNSAEDFLDGGDGNDTLYGGTNDDDLRGRAGDDRLLGEKGKDDLRGGEGNDTLNGGEGEDKLMGDAGADLFIFGTGGSLDTIRDFNAVEGDKLRLEEFIDLYKITGDGNDALKLTISGDDTILNVIWKGSSYWYYEVLHPICVFENQTGLSLQHMLATGQIELT